MIAGCPTCGARYRIDTSKLRAEGARLRCSRCETVFRVRPPEEPVVASPVAAPVSTPPQSTPSAAPRVVAASPRATVPAAVPPQADPARTVLIAHPEWIRWVHSDLTRAQGVSARRGRAGMSASMVLRTS